MAEQFPFPAEQESTPKPGTDAHAADTPKTGAPASAPGSTVEHPRKSAASDFPFPGEPESSSSSSAGADSPETPEPETTTPVGNPAQLTRTQRRHLPKVEDLDRREAQDIEVSRFYFSTGDFRAAYLRAKDAVNTIPDDPEAHFALAESAAKLKKTEEAVAEYELYLKLDPDGLRAKSARKALTTVKQN